MSDPKKTQAKFPERVREQITKKGREENKQRKIYKMNKSSKIEGVNSRREKLTYTCAHRRSCCSPDEAKWSPERPQRQRKLSRRDLKRTKEKGKNQSSSEPRLWRLSFVLFTDPARNSQPGHPTHSWAARPITRPTFSFILRPR